MNGGCRRCSELHFKGSGLHRRVRQREEQGKCSQLDYASAVQSNSFFPHDVDVILFHVKKQGLLELLEGIGGRLEASGDEDRTARIELVVPVVGGDGR